MTEGIDVHGILEGGHQTPTRVLQALAGSDDHVALVFVDSFYIGQELVFDEGSLRHVDQIGRVVVGHGGGGRHPATVAPHGLDHLDHFGVAQRHGIAHHLGKDNGFVTSRAAKAGCVIGQRQVVVDGFGDAHHPHLVATRSGGLPDLIGVVHGIAAADVEEVADVVGLAHLDHSRIILVAEFVATGAQRRRRRAF